MSDEQQTGGRGQEAPAGPEVRYTRRPRMVPFLATGALLGLLAGLLVVVLGPESDVSGGAQEVILLGTTGALLGGLLGGIVFLLVERRSR